MFITDLSCDLSGFLQGSSSLVLPLNLETVLPFLEGRLDSCSEPPHSRFYSVLSVDVLMYLPCVWQPTFSSNPDANFDPFLVILSHFCQEWVQEVEARRLRSQHCLPLNSVCDGYTTQKLSPVGTRRQQLCLSSVWVWS